MHMIDLVVCLARQSLKEVTFEWRITIVQYAGIYYRLKRNWEIGHPHFSINYTKLFKYFGLVGVLCLGKLRGAALHITLGIGTQIHIKLIETTSKLQPSHKI